MRAWPALAAATCLLALTCSACQSTAGTAAATGGERPGITATAGTGAAPGTSAEVPEPAHGPRSGATLASTPSRTTVTPSATGSGASERPAATNGSASVAAGGLLVAGDAAESAVDRLLAAMTLRQRIGQRFVTWFGGTTVNAATLRLIEHGYVAGVIIGSDNVDSYLQVRRLTKRLHQAAAANQPPVQLLVAADQEGGRVARFRFPEMAYFPPAFTWAEHHDAAYVEAAAYLTGRELRRLGVNVNLAPVLDVYAADDHSVVGDRSFGGDPARVAALGIAYLDGARRAGIIPVVKHFPGHGVTRVDSHGELPVVDLGVEQLLPALLPFRRVIEHGAPMVMSAHILYAQVDDRNPATFSRRIIGDILRGELGFDGLLISDAIEMRAISDRYTADEIVRRSVEAGVDLILVASRLDTLRLQDALLRQVESGQIPEQLIDEGARRVLLLKYRNGLLDDALAAADAPPSSERGGP